MATSNKVLRKLKAKFHDLDVQHDEDKATVRIVHPTLQTGLNLDLPRLEAKYDQKGDAGLEDTFSFITLSFEAMEEKKQLQGKLQHVFPVIRSTSFPTETKDQKTLIHEPHTAETRIYYALDQGKTYALIDEGMLESEQLDEQAIKEAARFNLRSLETDVKVDEVAGNRFYFLNSNDGYDASRILNEAWVKEMASMMEGSVAFSIPHQDVLIVADIRNDQGYDVLGQMTFQFFKEGRVPVTALPFSYEDEKLEPIFILARKKPKGQ
ncbi:hypothetical protein DH09_01730 [Bacillaceae bacterium JMAK1]|nr:hypothetical protein DH09_01730 [Bacillaceae bacterium JMAK1]